LGYVLQPARANAVGPLLIFLNLLERQYKRVSKVGLAHFKHQAAQAHAAANMLVDGIKTASWHFGSRGSANSPSDRPRLARAFGASISNRVFEIDEKTRIDAFVCFVDQHAPLYEEWLKPFEHDINHRFEQGMTGCNEFGLWLSRDQVLLERDAGVAIEHRIGAADQAVALLQDRRHPRDFEAALFAFGNAAAKHREGFAEERADEVRLKAARLRPLHLLADFADRMRVHALRCELALSDELFDRIYVAKACRERVDFMSIVALDEPLAKLS
jgi:hypothetical protein